MKLPLATATILTNHRVAEVVPVIVMILARVGVDVDDEGDN